MKNFVQPGHVINFTPTVAVVSGQVCAVAGLLVVANKDIAANTEGQGFTEGVFVCGKVTAAVIKKGEPLVWHAATGLFDAAASTQATGDIAGSGVYAWEDAGNGTTSFAVKFAGVPGTVHA